MNKKLLILPLVSLLIPLSACSPIKKNKSSSQSDSISLTSTSVNPNVPKHAEEVAKGETHALPWNLNYESFKDPGGSLSYETYNKTYEFSGTNVYGYGMRAVTDISINVNGELVTYKGMNNIHFCKLNHDKWPDGGQLQISDVQPQKMVIEAIVQSTRTYDPKSAVSIYYNSDSIDAPNECETTVSALYEEFSIQTITFDINASEPGVITIINKQRFSMYFQSIRFE